MHFSLAQDNVKMLPFAVNVVLAVHRSLCRNFHACIFDCAIYSCLAVSEGPLLLNVITVLNCNISISQHSVDY